MVASLLIICFGIYCFASSQMQLASAWEANYLSAQRLFDSGNYPDSQATFKKALAGAEASDSMQKNDRTSSTLQNLVDLIDVKERRGPSDPNEEKEKDRYKKRIDELRNTSAMHADQQNLLNKINTLVANKILDKETVKTIPELCEGANNNVLLLINRDEIEDAQTLADATNKLVLKALDKVSTPPSLISEPLKLRLLQQQARVLLGLSRIALAQQNPHEALKLNNKVIALTGNKPDLNFERARALLDKGAALHYLGRDSEAESAARSAADLFRRDLGTQSGHYADAKNFLAWVQCDLGHYDDAIASAREAYSAIGNRNATQQAGAICRIATAKILKNELPDIRLLNQAIDALEHIVMRNKYEDELLAECLWCKSKLSLTSNGQAMDSTKAMCLRALTIHGRTGISKDVLLQDWYLYGEILARDKDTDAAAKMADGLKIARSFKLNDYVCSILTQLARPTMEEAYVRVHTRGYSQAKDLSSYEKQYLQARAYLTEANLIDKANRKHSNDFIQNQNDLKFLENILKQHPR